MKLTDREQVILRAISQVGRGGLAEISKVVKAVGYPKDTTKKVLVSLSKKGIVHLHRHDWPSSLKPEDRKLMVRHEGVYYNAVSVMRRNPTQSKRKAALKKTGRALKGAARSLLQSGSEILGAGAMALNPRGKHLPGLPAKAQREYEKILKEAKASGRYKGREKEVAARIVRKQYARNALKRAKMPTWIKSAIQRVRPNDPAYSPDRVGQDAFMHTSKAQRDTFDQYLVSIGHPSAYEAGTQEYRIKRFVRERASKRPKRNKTVIRAGRIDHLDVSKVHNPRKKKAAKKRVKRNAPRTITAAKTAKRRAGSSSKSSRKAKSSKVRSVAKTRKASTRRASNNPTRKGMRKLYREAKRISKITRGRYFSSESGQRKAARHEKQRTRKGRRNPSAESIRKEFAGSVNGERDLFFPQGTPSGKLAKLGKLVSITTEEGIIKPVHGSAWLCADTKERLHIGSTSNAPLFSGPARSLGKVSKVEYESSKPHLGYKGPIIWFHHMGERGGTKPTLHADGKGGLVFKGGNYTLTRRGIEH